ncbi:4-hydroxy-3-methylbut-2-enyl diphosphate reductase [Tundrisphaera sp. TA3]|uniref:4-hydroxy-3-methylbut-2-enyl diphosphate reductase n=1 Tax=Tundrisphaera sp. TA3 TaxID=3435775 RepID=UPI003EC0A8C9
MKIIRAEEMGMCFGVRDALKIAGAVRDPSRVTIHGELVHNPEVTRRLADAGFRQAPEGDRDPPAETPLVLITAHGVSEAERKRLESAGKTLIDATCPLVRRVHEAAQELAAEGRHVLLIGKPGHVEVRGIAEDLERCDVIGGVAEVRAYASGRLGIVCQTTMPPDVVDHVHARIRLLNPEADIRMVDTVCLPTRLRQRAMFDLLGRVDAVVVVGGRNSNNTRRLVELCRQHRVPAHHVESAADLDPAWFEGFAEVGLTAGTSTLDETIDEVQRALERIGMNSHEEARS